MLFWALTDKFHHLLLPCFNFLCSVDIPSLDITSASCLVWDWPTAACLVGIWHSSCISFWRQVNKWVSLLLSGIKFAILDQLLHKHLCLYLFFFAFAQNLPYISAKWFMSWYLIKATSHIKIPLAVLSHIPMKHRCIHLEKFPLGSVFEEQDRILPAISSYPKFLFWKMRRDAITLRNCCAGKCIKECKVPGKVNVL